mmetsp:Transcript_2934/g.6577  ORF Transcript_2934/g.6577 Transcript_2934/m.6577 type:complete len:128 (-) Transcript_2934:82-465(-)
MTMVASMSTETSTTTLMRLTMDGTTKIGTTITTTTVVEAAEAALVQVQVPVAANRTSMKDVPVGTLATTKTPIEEGFRGNSNVPLFLSSTISKKNGCLELSFSKSFTLQNLIEDILLMSYKDQDDII